MAAFFLLRGEKFLGGRKDITITEAVTMKQLAMYRDIEISERQIETGQVKDARKALGEMRAKYGL